ncbi:MAG: N-acetylmuramoyl-L-alanine amidase [Bacteroides sp.]|nr:N-acetylmuramoyl-L-alanine amidase [Bacteroides sp.]
MRKITKIIIHCTATKAGREVSVAEIDRWHREQGFNSIGYHYVVGLDGKVHKGRDEAKIGAHCLSQNSCSIGVVYVGGLDAAGKAADTRTNAQKESLRQLISSLLARYPNATIHSHYEFTKKDCPCFDAGKEYASLLPP